MLLERFIGGKDILHTTVVFFIDPKKVFNDLRVLLTLFQHLEIYPLFTQLDESCLCCFIQGCSNGLNPYTSIKKVPADSKN